MNFEDDDFDDEDDDFESEEEFEQRRKQEQYLLDTHPLMQQGKEIVRLLDALIDTALNTETAALYIPELRDSARIIVAKLTGGIHSLLMLFACKKQRSSATMPKCCVYRITC